MKCQNLFYEEYFSLSSAFFQSAKRLNMRNGILSHSLFTLNKYALMLCDWSGPPLYPGF